jgi:hypothetical protein
MLETISAKVTATPGLSGWAQVYEFVPEDPDKILRRGKLYSIISTKKADSGIDSIAAGRELIGRLHEEYFGSSDDKPFNTLRNAVQTVITEFGQKWGDVEIAVCAQVAGVVYSAAGGGSRVIIARGGATATILASSDEVIAASGYPKLGDIILLATKSFFERIPVDTIKTALASATPQLVAEAFSPIVMGADGNGTVGAIVIKFDGSEEPQNISVSPEIPPPEKPAFDIKKKFSAFFTNVFKKIPQRSIYIRSGMGDEATSKSRKLTFSVGVILLVILVVSIGFGIRQKSINDFSKKYQGILAQASNDIDQAISIASTNPDQSRQLFMDSEEKLAQVQALKVHDPKVAELQQKITDSQGAVLGEYEGNPQLFLDLGLLSSGFKGDTVTASGGNIFILDKSGERVVSVAIDTKKSMVVAGPTVITGATAMASYNDNVYILSSDGIYSLGIGETKVIDKTWAGDVLINAFAGNFYILDKSGNKIYRYSGQSGNTFGPQQNWLSASTKADFSGAVGWGMDGAIYVLYPNSKILKYSLGSPQNFSISGIVPQIGNTDAIYADPDNQYVYLLDRAGKRVVATDKKGNYKAQYTNDQIAGATGLVVSEAQKEIILLTGDKLLSIQLKNI